MSIEIDPSYFDSTNDVPELIDYLLSAEPIQESAHQTPEEKVIQTAKNMATSWVQYVSQIESIGRRYSTDQFVRDSRSFLLDREASSHDSIGIVNLAGSVALHAAQTSSILEEDLFMREPSTELLVPLLVGRLRAAGFTLPEVGGRNVFSSDWRNWKRYGANPL